MRPHYFRMAETQLTRWYERHDPKTLNFFQEFAGNLDSNDYYGAVLLVEDQTAKIGVQIKPKNIISNFARMVTKVSPYILPGQTATYARIWSTGQIDDCEPVNLSYKKTRQAVSRHLDGIIERGELKEFLEQPAEFLPPFLTESARQKKITAKSIAMYLTTYQRIETKKRAEIEKIGMNNIIPFPTRDN